MLNIYIFGFILGLDDKKSKGKSESNRLIG